MKKELKNFLKVAIRAAKSSGTIQQKALGKRHHIQFKGEINIVTEVDKACEAKILRMIHQKFPDHDFLCEESGTRQSGKSPSDFKWVIDPLDGTTNYAHGYPLFCTSMGLEYRGCVIAGVVFDPNRNELFSAVRGGGSFLNGKKIRVSQVSPLKRALLVTGFSYNLRIKRDNNMDRFKRFLMAAQAVRRDGVAAIDLCYVACGRYDGFWELDLWPWDTAAGRLILEEAGGQVTRFDGAPYTIYDKQILASNGKIHKSMIDVLKSG